MRLPHKKNSVRRYADIEYKRTRQIIRYRETATLRRPQIKQYTDSKDEGGVQTQRKHHIILTKYEAVHRTGVSENNSSSEVLTMGIKLLKNLRLAHYLHTSREDVLCI